MTKRRILLVDDEPAFTRVMRNYLEGTGRFEVHMVNDPTEVVWAARTFQPDLVLLDVIMPDMDGGEVASQLKSDPACSSIKHVVFLTAILSKDDVHRHGDRIGGQPFLVKPIDAPTLVSYVDDLFAKAA